MTQQCCLNAVYSQSWYIYIYIIYIYIYILYIYIYIYYKRLWEQSLTTDVVVRSPSLFSQASHPSTEGSVASRVHPAARGGGWDHLLPQSSAFQWQVYRPTKKKSHYRNLEENGGHIIYTYLHHPANHLSTLFFGGAIYTSPTPIDASSKAQRVSRGNSSNHGSTWSSRFWEIWILNVFSNNLSTQRDPTSKRDDLKPVNTTKPMAGGPEFTAVPHLEVQTHAIQGLGHYEITTNMFKTQLQCITMVPCWPQLVTMDVHPSLKCHGHHRFQYVWSIPKNIETHRTPKDTTVKSY